MSRKPKKRKKQKVPIVPRLGPPQNIRPAGAHAGRRSVPRAEDERAALREQLDDG